MSKETIHVKSNGIRNELKEIRNSIDALTNALIEIHIAQTHKQNEKNSNCTCGKSNRKLRKSNKINE